MVPLSKTKSKYIKSLQHKKNRDKENRFLVEGKKSVLEFLSSDFSVELIAATEEFYEEYGSSLDDVEQLLAKPAELSVTGTLKSNNAAIAVVRKPEDNVLSADYQKVILGLDGINDPGNLGTIIRTADWFGIEAVLLNDESVDPYNPKVVNASKGSFSRVKVYKQSLPGLLADYKGEVLAADMFGKSINELEPISSCVLVMGSESHGISHDVEKHITTRVTIPSAGHAESLNVGVATGIICQRLFGKS